MVKKAVKSGSKKNVKKGIKAAAAKMPVQAVAEKKAPEKQGKKGIFIVLALLFLAFVALEVFVIVNKSIKQNKKPVYVTSWAHNYRGCTSIGEYGDYIYGIDNTRGDVYRTNKNTGILEKYINYPEGVNSAMEDSKGTIFVLTRTNEVLEISPADYSIKKKHKLASVKNALWMEIDGDDNFYVVCPVSSSIVKYNSAFEEIAKASSEEAGNELTRVSKVFSDVQGDIYLQGRDKEGQLEIIVYNKDLKRLRAWSAKGIKKVGPLTNMAVSKDKNLYINSYEESRIYVFNAIGKLQGSFDRAKDSQFQIIYAASVTGGKNGKIYVYTHKLGVLETINY